MARYSKIKNFDIANGEGLGVSIYFSGCDATPKCKGCFNSELWKFDKGNNFTVNVMYNELFELLKNPHIDHLSILGGEPLALNNISYQFNKDGSRIREMSNVTQLVLLTKNLFPDKKIWLWTHYTWGELMNNTDRHFELIRAHIIPYLDVLVDGRFEEEHKDLKLKWCGSSNQRVIDVKKSLIQNKIVTYE